MVKHNNTVANIHLRKHWYRRTKCHFNQPAQKLVRHQRRVTKAVQSFPRPIQKLRPVVSSATKRYAGKVRYGRGFTLDEIRGAGLTAAFARTVGISVDHRRTNTSAEQLQLNTERLNAYKSKLILFPRREGKPKKGEINDSTAEQLKSAAASHQVLGHVLPHVRPAKTEEFKAIGDAAKKQVYRFQRTLRVFKHYKGRRDRKAA